MTAYKRQPYMKWYARDWRGDAALRSCSFAARGLWADILSLIHDESQDNSRLIDDSTSKYGYLLIAGKQPSNTQLARMLGGSSKEIGHLISELENAGVFSRLDDGTIYSRRMVRDKEKEEIDRANGKGGGNPKLKGGVNPQVKAHSQKPEPKPEQQVVVVSEIVFSPDMAATQCQRLERLLGLDENDYIKHVKNVEALVDMARDGCDFDRHILPSAQAAVKSKPRTLAYLKPKALALRDAEKACKALPTPFEDCSPAKWGERVGLFRRKAMWSEAWGPKPGVDGCKAPPESLEIKEAAE